MLLSLFMEQERRVVFSGQKKNYRSCKEGKILQPSDSSMPNFTFGEGRYIEALNCISQVSMCEKCN